MIPENISDAEELSRFLFQKNHFSASKGRIKHHGLMPMLNEELNRWETSVFRTSFLDVDKTELWKIADKYAGLEKRKTLARGFFSGKMVREKNPLDAVPEPSKHPLHAALINWPNERDSQILLAKELVLENKMELEVR